MGLPLKPFGSLAVILATLWFLAQLQTSRMSLELLWSHPTRRSAPGSARLLWMTPRSGGLNNQLITVYEALRCAQKNNRTVVVPLIYENVRQDASTKGDGPFPFEDYFNISALEAIAPVTTPAELDYLGIPCHTIYYGTSWHFKANAKRIPRLLKQQYRKRYNVYLSFQKRFPPDTTAACVDDSLCHGAEFTTPSEFGKYSLYNETGQGYNIRRSNVFRDVRAALQPSRTVQNIANRVLDGIGGPFNAMHIRRGDFSRKCRELPSMCDEFGENSFLQSPEWILQELQEMPNSSLPLFVSTTHAAECREMLSGSSVRLVFMEDFELPESAEWASSRVDIQSYASQIVCGHAENFVGNRFSSFTSEINSMRQLNNDSVDLRFF